MRNILFMQLLSICLLTIIIQYVSDKRRSHDCLEGLYMPLFGTTTASSCSLLQSVIIIA